MDNTLQYNIKELINHLFENEDLVFGATLTHIKETKGYKNDGEAVFAISLSNSFKQKSTIYTVHTLHFENKYKGEHEENLEVLSKSKDLKKIAKEVVSLLPKEAVKEEKQLCKTYDGHTRNYLVFPVRCIAEILLPILNQEKEEMLELVG